MGESSEVVGDGIWGIGMGRCKGGGVVPLWTWRQTALFLGLGLGGVGWVSSFVEGCGMVWGCGGCGLSCEVEDGMGLIFVCCVVKL